MVPEMSWIPAETPIPLPPPRAEIVDLIAQADTLPRLDIGAFVAGEPGAKKQLAADIKYIQERLGFYVITNYGFDPGITNTALEQALKLFHLPEKAKLPYVHQGHMQGYWPARNFTNIRPGYEQDHEDLKTSKLTGWVFLRDRNDHDPQVRAGRRHRAMNKWPDESLLPDFRTVLSSYHTVMLDLGLKLVSVYAVALGLDEHYFDRDFEKPEWYNRLNYLPGTEHPADILGMSPHSDHSFLTLLPIAAVPGLQVRTPTGSWIDVKYVPDGLVVNTGEWLNRKSSGHFMATPHRVGEPTQERVSMPVFIDPNDDATSEPVPTVRTAGDSPRYPTVGWHEFFCSYIDGYTNAPA